MSKVFISYSRADATWLKRLRAHLRPLVRDGQIEVWDDTRITSGADWLKDIEEALAVANVAVLLVSADFLASDFIMATEVPALLSKAERGGCRIVPLILRPCLFSSMQALQKFQAVNPPNRPLTKLKKAEAEEFLVSLSRSLSEEISKPRDPRLSTDGPASPHKSVRRDSRVENLIRNVRLADWDAAEQAALDILTATDPTGRNELFSALLEYQDCAGDDDMLWGALQTIESCVKVAPWLLSYDSISRMSRHDNFSVRSAAASICMDLAEYAPDRVPLSILIPLSVYNEDWYVQAPANAALKTMVRSTPAVLQVFYRRLRSEVPGERLHAAEAIKSIAEKEARFLDPKRLKRELSALERIPDNEASKALAFALSKRQRIRRVNRLGYGI